MVYTRLLTRSELFPSEQNAAALVSLQKQIPDVLLQEAVHIKKQQVGSLEASAGKGDESVIVQQAGQRYSKTEDTSNLVRVCAEYLLGHQGQNTSTVTISDCVNTETQLPTNVMERRTLLEEKKSFATMVFCGYTQANAEILSCSVPGPAPATCSMPAGRGRRCPWTLRRLGQRHRFA